MAGFKSNILKDIDNINLEKLDDLKYDQLIKDIDNIESFLRKESKIN
jgi:hypothetical protein